MPTKWKLQDHITANNLSNNKFLFNFENKEDLQYVLQQGPFHYNFCMFVLVRWEPIIHENHDVGSWMSGVNREVSPIARG